MSNTDGTLITFQDLQYERTLGSYKDMFIVVKSQDQSQRRKRLISTRRHGKFGRTQARPTSTGLLARVQLQNSDLKINWCQEFPEPRHIIKLRSGKWLLSAVNFLVVMTEEGDIVDNIHDHYFAFLHSIQEHPINDGIVLVCSSGYDTLIEIDVNSGERIFTWHAWENGFNPDEDGNWLCISQTQFDKMERTGKKAKLISPNQMGEQGITTKYRTAHPNVAVYNEFNDCKSILVSIGHSGQIIEIFKNDLTRRVNLGFDLSSMPHGLQINRGDWWVADTTTGKIKRYSKEFGHIMTIDISTFPGKDKVLGEIEWVQNISFDRDGHLYCIDANRKFFMIDIDNKIYNYFSIDSEWCVQDAQYIFG